MRRIARARAWLNWLTLVCVAAGMLAAAAAVNEAARLPAWLTW